MDHLTSPTFEFDPTSERFTRDPYPDYAWLRANAPIYRWAQRDALLISRAAELRAFFSEPRLSTDVRIWAHYPGGALLEQPRYAAWTRLSRANLFQLSPEDHARVRKLANVGLTPQAVQRMEATIQRVVDAALAELVAGGAEVVNIREFAERIPLTVISDLLGIPDSRRAEFRRFGVAMVQSILPSNSIDVLNAIADTMTEGLALLEQLIAEARAAEPRPANLLGDWIDANEDARRLSDDELMSLVAILIIAGSDSIVQSICFAVHTLLLHPEALREIQADRSLLRGAIEEALRWDRFDKMSLMRYATEDFEFCGTPVRKGQLVVGLGGATGRDGELYVDPDRFDIRREQSGLIFGFGRRFCLGAHLARGELAVALGTLLIDRFPEAELAGPVVFDHENPVIRVMRELPVRLGPDHGRSDASA